MNGVTIPMPRANEEVAAEVPVIVDDLGLNKGDLEGAAKEFGLTTFRHEKLVASHTLGKAFKKIGVLKMGRSMLYAAAEHAQSGADQCEDILSKSTDMELRASVLPAKLGFTKELRESAIAFIRSAELDGNDDSDRKPGVKPFGAGMQAGPVIIAQQAVVNHTTQENP